MNAALVQPLSDLREALHAFGRAHPEIRRVQLFGSVARGEDRPDSDVDVVVSFTEGHLPRGMAGFTFLDDLEKELCARLERPVSLIESGAVENARRIGNRALPAALSRDSRLMYESEPATS